MPPAAAPPPGRVRTRPERAAAVVWALIAAGITVRVLLAPDTSHNVFLVYRQAALNWVAGADLYAPQPGLDVFHYSPLVAAGTVPFGVLPVKVGGVLWRLANLGVYLGGLAWCGRVLWPHLTPGRRGWLFLLIVPLSVASLNNGQSNALVLGLVLMGLAAAARGRWSLAAGLTAGAVLFKLYPVAVGLLLAACFPRRFALRFGAAVLAGVVLPFALQSPDYVLSQYRSWLGSVAADDRSGLPLHLWLRDIRLVFKVWFEPLTPAAFVALQLAAAALVAALCVLGRRRGWPAPRVLTAVLGLGGCWMTVFGPMVESCTWILVAPALSVGLVDAWADRRAKLSRAVLTLVLGLFLLDQSFGWWRGGRAYRGWAVQPVAGSLLFAVLVGQAIAGLCRGRPAVTTLPVPHPPTRQAA